MGERTFGNQGIDSVKGARRIDLRSQGITSLLIGLINGGSHSAEGCNQQTAIENRKGKKKTTKSREVKEDEMRKRI